MKRDKIGAIRFSRTLAKKALVVVVCDSMSPYTESEREDSAMDDQKRGMRSSGAAQQATGSGVGQRAKELVLRMYAVDAPLSLGDGSATHRYL